MGRLQPALSLAGAALLLTTSAALAVDQSPDPGASCWTAEPGTIGAIDHPTDPQAIVLRQFTGGGFVPAEIAFLESPVFTLYGNNVAIFRPVAEMGDLTDPLPPYQCALLTPEQVDELLAFALDEAGLRDASDLYEDPFIVDTPNTVFTIDADGVAKEVVVQALGFNPDAPDPEARARFETLAERLTAFVPADGSVAFDVPLYEAMLSEIWLEAPAEAIAWPWSDVSPDDFVGEGWAETTLTPGQAAQVVDVPSGGQGYIVLDLPDGTQQSLAVKPLLPDELASA
jgi:hypothetical protein